MATEVTTHCTHCDSDIKLKPDALGLYAFAPSRKGITDYYAFFCTRCRAYNCKEADSRVMELLISGGVILRMISVPLEVIERATCTTALNPDDLLNLVAYLRDHDFLPEPVPARRLRGAGRPQGAP